MTRYRRYGTRFSDESERKDEKLVFRRAQPRHVVSTLGWRLEHSVTWNASPVNALSADLLLAIFRCVVELEFEEEVEAFQRLGSHDMGRRVPISYRNAPLNFSCVNKTWRRITLSSGSLWTSMIIKEPRSRDKRREAIWLARSSQLPLSIHLQGSHRTTRQEGVDENAGNLSTVEYDFIFSEIVKPSCHERWRNIRLDSLTPMQCYLNPRQLHIVNAPLLEELHIRLRSYRFTDGQMVIINTAVSPNITHLQLEGPFAAMFVPDAPFSNLTDLDLQFEERLSENDVAFPSGQDILHVLSKAPNLRSLRASFSDEPLQFDPPQFRHPNLRTFCVATPILESQRSLAFVNHLTLPGLETFEIRLEIRLLIFRHVQCKDIIKGLLTRSQAPITTFLLEGDAFCVDNTFTEWLTLMPHLKTLTLKHCFVTDGLLLDMLRMQENPILPPLLELVVRYCKSQCRLLMMRVVWQRFLSLLTDRANTYILASLVASVDAVTAVMVTSNLKSCKRIDLIYLVDKLASFHKSSKAILILLVLRTSIKMKSVTQEFFQETQQHEA